MKCKYCGEEVNEGALICRYCLEFIGDGEDNRDSKTMNCKVCGSTIRSGAKKCRFCFANLSETQQNDEIIIVDKKVSKILETQNKQEKDEKQEKKSFFDRIKENWFLGLIILWVLYKVIMGALNSIFPTSGQSNNNVNSDIRIEQSKQVANNDSDIFGDGLGDDIFNIEKSDDGYLIQTDKSSDSRTKGPKMFGNVEIEADEQGYITRGEVLGESISCHINIDEIKSDKLENSFIKSINSNGTYKALNCSFDNDFSDSFIGESDNQFKKIGIFFDNSYGDNGDDKSGPNNRINSLYYYLTNERFPNNTEITLFVPYGNGEEKKGANMNFKEEYKFKIIKSEFPVDKRVLNNIYYKLISEGDYLGYTPRKNTFDIYGGYKFEFFASGFTNIYNYDEDDTRCKLDSQVIGDETKNNYICYDASNVYKKIKAIYERGYKDAKDKHRGNLLLNALSHYYDYVTWDDLYIVSDGEFEIGEGVTLHEDIQKFIKQSGSQRLEQYPLTNFHAKTYLHYNQDNTFTSFWDKTIKWFKNKKDGIKKCTKTKIHLIGATKAFGPYLEETYKKIFDGCEFVIDN